MTTAPVTELNYRIVRYDLPGHGDSPTSNGPYTMPGLADYVVALPDRLGIDRAHDAEGKFPEAGFERIDINGSGISLGDAVGATGGRILATLSRQLVRRDARYGLETMCIGGGHGLAAIFERVA